jgi:hypothetical protein
MAADEITARGRVLPNQVLADLRARGRTVRLAGVATRVRLSTSAEARRTTGSRPRERQREAFQAAGPSEWARGERTRFYRAETP